MVPSDVPNFCGDSLHGYARKTLLSGKFFSENIGISDCDKKCDKLVLQVYPRNWCNRLASKWSIFRTFYPKRVVGWLLRCSRGSSYVEPFGKRCLTVFFVRYWDCTVHSILNGFHTRISQKLGRKVDTHTHVSLKLSTEWKHLSVWNTRFTVGDHLL